MNHLGTIPLHTERLLLRRFMKADAQPMFQNWATDPEVTKYLTWQPHVDVDATRALLEGWEASYESPAYYHWVIESKSIGQPIGSIAAVSQRDEIAMVHIGYCLGRAWWGQGLMSEALAALLRFFFEDVGMNRIESRHDPRNPGSGRVMEKCGMVREGLSRKGDLNNQGICDAMHYAILAEDYAKRK